LAALGAFDTLWVGAAMRVGPTHLGRARIRPAQRGLARPALHTLCELKTLTRSAYSLARGSARFFFF